jgi:hypothetical protein
MNGRSFYSAALARLEPALSEAGFQRIEEGTYRKDQAPTFGMVHLAEDGDRVMPRLSVGMPRVSERGVVWSTDLHVLVSPELFFWYSAGDSQEEALARLDRDFRAHGLPWLARNMELKALTLYFERRVHTAWEPPRPHWWQRAFGGAREPQQRRKSPLDLQVLSHCYETLGRYSEALTTWQRYLSLLTEGGSLAETERLRVLEERVRGA